MAAVREVEGGDVGVETVKRGGPRCVGFKAVERREDACA